MFSKKIYDELRKDYGQALISQYRDLVNLGVTVQKDLGHKQILATAKRLELYDHFNDHEATMYAVKKRRFLMECTLDQYMYENPSYSGQSNQITHDQNELSMKIYYNKLAKYMFSYLFIPNQSGLLPIIAYWLFLSVPVIPAFIITCIRYRSLISIHFSEVKNK